MLDAQPHVLALGKIHGIGCLTPLPHRSPGDRSRNIQVPEQLLRRPHGYRFLFLQLAPGAQEQLWIRDDTFSYGGEPIAPGRIKDAHFMGAELTVGNLLGKAFAVIPFGARHRHQVLHGRVRSDLPSTNLFLDGLGQLSNQCQPARDPRHAPVEAAREIIKAEPKAAMQLGQKPALLKRGFSFRCAQGSIQYQCLGFIHVPDCGAHCVLAQAAQRPNPLIAVDDQETVGFLGQRNDHDRNLLA